MRRKLICLSFILMLMTMVHSTFAQYKGGIADGHSNIRMNNVVCIVINVNPYIGGSAGGAASREKINIVCAVINANPFSGGAGAGFAEISLTNISCTPVNVNPYIGGAGDGHADVRITNNLCANINVNPFLGGIGGGQSELQLINIICATSNVNPFLGGIGDGHSNMIVTNITCIPINVNPFHGGVSDGSGMASIINITCIPVNVNPFKGGFADGHANLKLMNVNCSVVNVNPFLGGVASGYSFKAITNIICGATTLPIQLIYFKAIPDGSRVLITWETATEINNDFFTVEKSEEDMAFEKVQNIRGAGNSNRELSYELTDENPFIGISYYRLKQTDYDGNYSYSEMEKVSFNKRAIANISPNPVMDKKEIVLSFENQNDEQVNIRIRDALGVMVSSFLRTAIKGENKLMINISGLHKGLYYLEINSSFVTEQMKLMVEN